MIEIDKPEIVAEVEAMFRRYEQALVGNDVAVLDELFWKSPLTLRFGLAENLYGHDAITSFRSARAPRRTVISTFGDDFGTANTEFVRGDRTGRQSHSWVRFPEGWRIVAAHV